MSGKTFDEKKVCLESLLEDLSSFFRNLELENNDNQTKAIVYNDGEKRKVICDGVYAKDKMNHINPFTIKNVYVGNISDLEDLEKVNISDLELQVESNLDDILHNNMGTIYDYDIEDELFKQINKDLENPISVILSKNAYDDSIPIYSNKFGGSLY